MIFPILTCTACAVTENNQGLFQLRSWAPRDLLVSPRASGLSLCCQGEGRLGASRVSFTSFLLTLQHVVGPSVCGAPVPTDVWTGLTCSRPGLLQPLVPGLQGPGRHPPQGLHLKGISWDHQKPAALITGILFLVSFAEFLQVFLVISQDPGRLVTVPPLCPQPCFLGTWPLGTTQIKNGESRLASGGTVYGQDV